ncbi:hypothetical protein XELAEV_18000471mg [Xenopus laevis]|uniref:Uncharacterized protein n=1 Tax=Xenopus laevis TaxID=8355 RepID=A0A974BNY1_XENLA|nr:hypothetical protein XELAEV_18000471mg [Xenopus laevis]
MLYREARPSYKAKSLSSELSCFFLPAGFMGWAGSPVGGDGRSGTLSAALARSSKNLSNSGNIKRNSSTIG